MKLETESGATIEHPSDEQIGSTLRELVSSGGGFAILSSSSRFTFKLRKTARENARWSTGKDPKRAIFAALTKS